MSQEIRMKNIEDEKTFQTKTKYGLKSRNYSDKCEFKVSMNFQFQNHFLFVQVNASHSDTVSIWGVVYESAETPIVLSNFFKEFHLQDQDEEVSRLFLFRKYYFVFI